MLCLPCYSIRYDVFRGSPTMTSVIAGLTTYVVYCTLVRPILEFILQLETLLNLVKLKS